MNDLSNIEVTTLYGAKSDLALVQVVVPDLKLQLEPEQARELAMNLLCAAEAAEGDEFVVNFGRYLGMDDRKATQFMLEFRRHRATNAEKWGNLRLQALFERNMAAQNKKLEELGTMSRDDFLEALGYVLVEEKP